ncbi:MAG: hypothetical protein Q8L56_11835 [Rhodocyclaceae bacterium]|nr:hypothetical protein [Rhodocyclaceae bacterium]
MSFNKLGLVPTILILIFLIKVVNGQFDDPDYYWHLKTGEYIVAHGMLPQADIFSYTNLGRPWVLDAWLSEVFIYLVHEWGGELGIKIFVAFTLVACFWFCYAICAKILAGDKAKALIVALLYCSVLTGAAPRPQLFTFLFFSLFLYLLLDFKYFGVTKRLWVIPLVMVLWANLHGGFFIGLVLVGLFILGEWATYFLAGGAEPSQRRRLIQLTLTGAAALLATLANPEFIRYWLYPFQALSLEANQGTIEEWRSPDFHQPIFVFWFAIVASFIAAMIYAPRKPDATELAVPLVFVAAAFLSRRNIPFAALAMAPFVAVYMRAGLTDSLSKFVMRFRPVRPGSPTGIRARASQPLGKHEYAMNWFLVLLTLLTLILIYPERQKTMAASLNTIIPVKATDFILHEGIEGRMFNTYHYGGYLIYRLFPRQLVFLDPRTPVYGDAFINNALAIYQGSSEWKIRFDRYGIDYVICESEAPLRQLLREEGTFHLVFDDGMHSVLLRDMEKYRPIIQRYAGKPAHD